MSYNLIIQTEAIIDVQAAFEWYENMRKGFGFELMKEIEICYQKIRNNPNKRIRLTGFLISVYTKLRTTIPLYITSCIQNKKRGAYNII